MEHAVLADSDVLTNRHMRTDVSTRRDVGCLGNDGGGMNRRLTLHAVKHSTNDRERKLRIRNFDDRAIRKLLTLRND